MPQQSVAVVGASADRRKFGNKAVRAYLKQGWNVYPVNPKGGQIEGLQVYASMEDVPVPVDRVTLYLPPDASRSLLPSIASLEPREFFVNPGAESEALVAEARALGLDPILACSITDIAASPAEFPD